MREHLIRPWPINRGAEAFPPPLAFANSPYPPPAPNVHDRKKEKKEKKLLVCPGRSDGFRPLRRWTILSLSAPPDAEVPLQRDPRRARESDRGARRLVVPSLPPPPLSLPPTHSRAAHALIRISDLRARWGNRREGCACTEPSGRIARGSQRQTHPASTIPTPPVRSRFPPSLR